MKYLCTPYSPPSSILFAGEQDVWRSHAYELALRLNLWLNHDLGRLAISPIVHWHYSALTFGLGKDAKTFVGWNKECLRKCDEVVFPAIPCLLDSVGVRQEMIWAKEMEKAVIWMDYIPESIVAPWTRFLQSHQINTSVPSSKDFVRFRTDPESWSIPDPKMFPA